MADISLIEWSKILPAAAAGGLVGFLSARVQDFLVRRRRFRALASALRAEVARLRKEFGEPLDVIADWVAFDRAKAVPEIHPWIARIVLESADLNPELAMRFLTLDTQVSNYSLMFMSLREARTRVADLTKSMGNTEPTQIPNSDRVVPPEEDLSEAEGAFQMLQEVTASLRKDAWKTLDRIDSLLAPYAATPTVAEADNAANSESIGNL